MQEQRYTNEPIEGGYDSDISTARLPVVCTNSFESEALQVGPIATRSEEAIEEAHEWLDSIRRRPRRYFDPLVLWIFAVPLWSMYQYLQYGIPFPRLTWLLQLGLTTLTPAAICNRVSHLRREAREDRLAEIADCNWIGPLIEALDAPSARQRSAARRVLPRLLAKLKFSDAGLLTGPQQTQLIYTLRLNKPGDMDLNMAIVTALERVGDEAALAAIEYVGESRVWLPSQRFVQQIAKNSMDRMEARLAESHTYGSSSEDTVVHGPTITPAAIGKQRQSIPEVDALKRQLKEEQEGRTAPGMRRPFLLAAWTTLLPGSLWLTIQSYTQHELLPAAVYGTLFGLTTQLPRYVLSKQQAIAAQRLAAFDNVQGVGPLAEALEWPDPAIRETAAKSLTRLLPLLNASDAGLLTGSQRGCLHRVLRMGNARKHEALITAVLKALEQVGDEAAVPYVKQLASSSARTRIQQRVKDCARECLPFLEIGANQRQGSQTLLRASSIDATQPDILLRSASSASVIEPVQLLRAGTEIE